MTENIIVKSAFACDDIRVENTGKLIAMGLINPILGLSEDEENTSKRPVLRLHFILSIDVLKAGDYSLNFRLRGIDSPRGQTVKLRVVFTQVAKNIPFPVGPLIIPLDGEEHGFKLQQQVGDRWRTISIWHFGDDNKFD